MINDGLTDERRLVEAAAWRTHLTELELESTPAFETWLANDPRNAAAWSCIHESWDLLGEHATAPDLLELRRKALGEARDAGRNAWRKDHLNRRWPVAIAAGIGVLAIAAFLAWSLVRPDVYRTAVGERRSVTLADGSRLQLDALAEVRVDYSEQARVLKLVKGQARFDVAHDVERPFSVLAAGQKVIATGTAFNVDLLGKDLLVTLIEGHVVIVPQNAAAEMDDSSAMTRARSGAHSGHDEMHDGTRRQSHAIGTPPSRLRRLSPIELTTGQQLRISAAGTSRVGPANVQQTTAWQTGQLIFDNEPLAAVIVRVNRYTARPLSVVDERVAALRISGVFNAGDTDGFIATITHYLPVAADYSDDDTVSLKAR